MRRVFNLKFVKKKSVIRGGGVRLRLESGFVLFDKQCCFVV